jgi:hypothetical protein
MYSTCSYAFNRLYLLGINQTRSDGKPSAFIKELLIRALTKSPGVSTSGLSFYRLQPLHTPLTTISTCVEVKPLGSLIEGIVVSSKQIVLPQAWQTKCTWSSLCCPAEQLSRQRA